MHNFEEMMTRNFWRLVQLLSVEMSLKYSPLNSSLIYNASAAFILGKNMKYWVIYLGFVCPAQNTELCNSNFKGNYSTSKRLILYAANRHSAHYVNESQRKMSSGRDFTTLVTMVKHHPRAITRPLFQFFERQKYKGSPNPLSLA